MTQEEREALFEKLYGEPGFGIWMGNFRDILINEEANAAITAFIAKKIRHRVKNPKVADKLIPKDHGFGTRRSEVPAWFANLATLKQIHSADCVAAEGRCGVLGQGDALLEDRPGAVVAA